MGPLPRDSAQPLNWSTWTVSVNHECVGERRKLTNVLKFSHNGKIFKVRL